MSKSKRTAEDIVRLIDLEGDPLPPCEMAKVGRWLKAETRKIRREEGIICLVIMIFAVSALAARCKLVSPPNPESPDIFQFLPSLLPFVVFGAWCAGAYAHLKEIGRCRRAYLQGFVRGLRVREPGAPKKWTMAVCREAIAAVQAVAAERRMSVARSIEIVKKRDPERWRGLSEPRYYEAVRRLQKSAT